MKKGIFALLCLSLVAGALKAQTPQTTPGGMPLPVPGQTPLPHKTPEQRADAMKALPPGQVAAPVQSDPGGQQQQINPKAGKFKFAEEAHDYGNVPEGPVAEYDFKFKNVGKSPIVITEAHGSCGCTTANWPHDPILPKHSGVIHVMYNTVNRLGAISKDVIINSNAQQSPYRLHITGNVTASAKN